MDLSIDTDELRKLAGDLTASAAKTEAVSSAMMSKVAKDLHQDARSNTPVATGALRESIYLRGGKDYRTVGTDLRYAMFVEFGTSDTSPQPFIHPAARKAEQSLFDEFRKLADPLP